MREAPAKQYEFCIGGTQEGGDEVVTLCGVHAVQLVRSLVSREGSFEFGQSHLTVDTVVKAPCDVCEAGTDLGLHLKVAAPHDPTRLGGVRDE